MTEKDEDELEEERDYFYNDDIYDKEMREELLDEDVLSDGEEAFMQGYEEA